MTFTELNFELPTDISAARQARLLDMALGYLRGLSAELSHREQRVDYTGPDGHALTVTHIVRLAQRGDVVDFEGHIAALSYALRQDCIAVRYADGSGTLEGPDADAWGAFNPEFFVRF